MIKSTVKELCHCPYEAHSRFTKPIQNTIPVHPPGLPINNKLIQKIKLNQWFRNILLCFMMGTALSSPIFLKVKILKLIYTFQIKCD